MTISFEGRDIISIKDLTRDDILTVLRIAKQLKEKPQPTLLKNHVLATLFFEPSTRTRLSFETAMKRLGGTVIGFADANVSSASKGETLYDSIRIIGNYADVIAMRHPLEGAARRAAEATIKPILNGGDGANQHPTQTLLDLFTIHETQHKLKNLHIALVGDLKYGRTVHSLAQSMVHFPCHLHLVAPESLAMPVHIVHDLKKNHISFSLHHTFENILPKLDILYMTRIQKERFSDLLEYEREKNTYVITAAMLTGVKKNLRILHPLPRVNEIHPSVDETPYAYYFEQAENGVFVRQALLALVLGKLS
ncbi:MAG: Aspartate carbamoyltransferase [Candidatus Magasanikbacteria bacterium GW2011_GWA2_45_39]|uniref:Aspartate carbamoyltransferase n=2 Tax=Candidatus Magasanikiibacteriota TaxID=1752731 RepID=A0A0G1N1T0_9BACT|nr:MAG: Aspartate carbamoyltransferase [Candidatus Magasanikbacteria bacterium GW2011_GWA2_45_39]KKU14312.1 MAG: Aspartate carbamoyltransferase [Candidatus Magasanikbacteria bacterium GW2011_GWC2_45_8]HBW74317.1 aspartate carbamoyltransferase [Candidatus Magasanikbacteria bacterium]